MVIEQISIEKLRELDNTPGATRTRWLDNKWNLCSKTNISFVFCFAYGLASALVLCSSLCPVRLFSGSSTST